MGLLVEGWVGGVMQVGAIADGTQSPEWLPLPTVFDYLDQREPQYQGSNETDPRFATTEQSKASMARLFDFYNNGRYDAEKAQFEAWLIDYKQKMREEIQKYYGQTNG
jgi:hypothetical protein